jgi:hypothetical protein
MVLFVVGCIGRDQEAVMIYYVDSQGQRVLLKSESYYDVEEKPTVFFIQNPSEKFIYIVEVYRIIDSKEHFYRSFSLSNSDFASGFDLEGVFTNITTPFVVSTGFTIKICRSDKKNYLKLNRRDQCNLSSEYKILK